MLLYRVNPAKGSFLTKPMRRDARIATHKGTIEHNGIIGKQVRDVVTTDKGMGNGCKLCFTRADKPLLQVELTGFSYRHLLNMLP